MFVHLFMKDTWWCLWSCVRTTLNEICQMVEIQKQSLSIRKQSLSIRKGPNNATKETDQSEILVPWYVFLSLRLADYHCSLHTQWKLGSRWIRLAGMCPISSYKRLLPCLKESNQGKISDEVVLFWANFSPYRTLLPDCQNNWQVCKWPSEYSSLYASLDNHTWAYLYNLHNWPTQPQFRPHWSLLTLNLHILTIMPVTTNSRCDVAIKPFPLLLA